MKEEMIMRKDSYLRKFKSGMGFILFIVGVVMLQITGTVGAQEDAATKGKTIETANEGGALILKHDKIPSGNLAESHLAGKVMRYKYVEGVLVSSPLHKGPVDLVSFGEYVELRWRDQECTWIGLEGKFAGRSGTQACGQIEVAPNIFFVTWLESEGEVVTQVINLNAKTVHTSYLGEKALEFLRAEIHEFGPASE